MLHDRATIRHATGQMLAVCTGDLTRNGFLLIRRIDYAHANLISAFIGTFADWPAGRLTNQAFCKCFVKDGALATVGMLHRVVERALIAMGATPTHDCEGLHHSLTHCVEQPAPEAAGPIAGIRPGQHRGYLIHYTHDAFAISADPTWWATCWGGLRHEKAEPTISTALPPH